MPILDCLWKMPHENFLETKQIRKTRYNEGTSKRKTVSVTSINTRTLPEICFHSTRAQGAVHRTKMKPLSDKGFIP
jgi:hypothetical protein